MITTLAGAWVRQDVRVIAQQQFEHLADRTQNELTRRMSKFVYGLNGARGVFVASKSVELDEFRAYARSRDLPLEFAGAMGQGFIQRVRREDVGAFQESVRADGAPGFTVRSSGDAAELYVIKFIEPQAPNLAALGLDIGSEPVRREAAERAMRTGKPALTGRIDLVQDDQSRHGMLYLVPVFREGRVPETQEERERTCMGWTYMPITAEGALEGIGEASDGEVDLSVYDGEGVSAGALLFRRGGEAEEAAEEAGGSTLLRVRSKVMIGGREWILAMRPAASFSARTGSALPAAVGAMGGVLTLLLAAMVWNLGTSKGRAVEMARLITADLSRAMEASQTARLAAESALREMASLRAGLDQHSILSVTDRSGRIIDANVGFCEISGFTREELLGKDHRIVNSGRHPREFWVGVWREIAAGRPWRGEVCNRAKNGALYWVDSTIVPFHGADGEIEKYVSIRFDITAKKEADLQNARLVAIVTSTEDAIISVDPQGVVLTWNRGAEQLFGYMPVEAEGRPLLMLMSDDRVEADQEMFHRTLRGESTHRFETRWERLDGLRLDVAVSISPIRDESERIIGASIIARDITEQKQGEADLLEATERAEAANASKSEFLANMSHEIRTPMTAILGYADLLAEDNDQESSYERRLEYIETIRRNGTHLLTVINDILDLSKIEAGKLTIEHLPTQTEQLLVDVLALLDGKAQSKGVRLTAAFSTPTPAAIMTGPVRRRQILVNLVGNALKFTDTGEVAVRVGVEWGGQRIRFDVADSGIGMTEEQIGRLFGAFVQADTSTTRRYGGTGLGLRISKMLAEKLGGDITVRSTPGTGSVFCVTIDAPAIPGSGEIGPGRIETGVAGDTARSSAAASAAAPPRSLAGVRIMLAEDGKDNQRLISFYLRKAGADVRIVENGRQALEALTIDGTVEGGIWEPLPVDVILTDIQMPEMDGYTVARLLRRKGCTLPIIALTANAMTGDAEKCIAAGCDGYAAKPIDKLKLIELCAAAAAGELRPAMVRG